MAGRSSSGASDVSVVVSGADMLRRAVSSMSCASRESVTVVLAVDLERMRLMRLWNARRSCFRFAEIVSLFMIDFASVRR